MPDDVIHTGRPPAFARSDTGDAWVASRYADVQAVLADPGFEVPAAGPAGPVGTISWLRASVSRFTNGAEHRRRRAAAIWELRPLHPDALRRAAYQRSGAAVTAAVPPGGRFDVMALLARRVPMLVLAEALGADEADEAAEAAEAAIKVAAGYFPGSAPGTQPAADAGTARLLCLLGPGPAGRAGRAEQAGRAGLEAAVARIALMVQACDATAGLIGTTLHHLQDAGATSAGQPAEAVPAEAVPAEAVPAEAVLAEVLRQYAVLRASRRVASVPAGVNGSRVAAGDIVLCNVAAANAEAAAAAPAQPGLTFGYGVRPCPGQPQALALAAGVVDAVRHTCGFLPGQRVEYESPSPLSLPLRLDVERR